MFLMPFKRLILIKKRKDLGSRAPNYSMNDFQARKSADEKISCPAQTDLKV